MVLGAGNGGREADFSADGTDVNPVSATLAPRSALLETHLQAWGKHRGRWVIGTIGWACGGCWVS